jgi:hypothetical protein
MFNKPSQHLNPACISVNKEFQNKIVKPRTFFAGEPLRRDSLFGQTGCEMQTASLPFVI